MKVLMTILIELGKYDVYIKIDYDNKTIKFKGDDEFWLDFELELYNVSIGWNGEKYLKYNPRYMYLESIVNHINKILESMRIKKYV